jgi:hypothetical protein
MTFAIDRTTWRKDRRPVGTGWDYRVNGRKGTKLIIHTTNGNRGSSFEGECKYLFNSNSVGANFVVGKAGQIAELVPVALRAWHAGVCKAGWTNNTTIGIECHHAVGETWTIAQRNALTWLVIKLMVEEGIGVGDIDTHREVALPPGRKIDPSDWTNRSFYDWRNSLDDVSEMPSWAFPADPELLDEWTASGKQYNGNLFAPGWALTPLFAHTDGQRYQIYERTAARITYSGAIEWLFTAEVEALKKARGL